VGHTDSFCAFRFDLFLFWFKGGVKPLLSKLAESLMNMIQFYGISEIRLHLLVELPAGLLQSIQASSKVCRPSAPHTPPTPQRLVGSTHGGGAKPLQKPPVFRHMAPTLF
jgi:hypothetical protein